MKEARDQHRARGQTGSRNSEPPSSSTNHRYSNLIHDSDIFLTKLREFKPQSLGCLEARRKSSSTLIFPSPQQACLGPSKCPNYPHNVKPTTGYWIECHGPGPQPIKCQTGDSSSRFTGTTGEPSTGELLELSGDLPASSKRQLKQKPDELKLGVGETLTASSRSLILHPITPTPDRVSSTTRHHEKQSVSSHQDELDQLFSRQDLGLRRSSTDSSPGGAPPTDYLSESTRPTSELSKYETGRHSTNSRHDSATIENSNRNLMRKRLSKRTMTKDDIDMHKPRRTPNITITEPSFNQSIITYHSSFRQASAIGQESQWEKSTTEEHVSTASDEQIISGEIPLVQKSQKPMSPPVDILSQRDNSPESLVLDSSIDTTTRGHGESMAVESLTYQETNTLQEFKPYRPQHRPSIIREDIDQENDGTTTSSKGITNQGEFYCGLSTTTFQKKPYQQSYQQQPENNVDQYEDGSLELISFEEENYEKHYYGREHWNYFTNDELLGPVMLSLKQEVNNQRDHFHVLLRTVSYTLHGTIPASTICADRYDREAIVRELSEIAKLKPPLMLGQLPSTPEELLKLDHIFIKTELKVGVIYIKADQAESEEAILGNKEESPLFTEFLELLGDRITLKGFDRYKGGLDTVHNLTGTESVYTMWRNIEIMFHVSTMLPHEENDPQKLQKKRHIGNDIVCVAFIEGDDTLFWPGCIKSYFLHTFIAVRTSLKPLKEDEKRKYSVSCVCRNEVQYAFKPYLVEEDEFFKSDYFREWLLVKIVNGERASYSAPKFARMQDRTRSQLLEDIITNLANHLVTGQIPKPYRRGSWRPLGHTRVSSPLEDSMKDYFEDYDQLAKDFCSSFCGPSRSMLCDVVFRVKDKDGSCKLVHGVRAILALRSRTFLEMLYGFVPPGAGSSSLQNQTSLRAIEMKALSGESSSFGREAEPTKDLLAKRGSVGADSSRRTGSHFLAAEKERRQSMLPNLSKSVMLKPNYLTVPSTSSGGGGGGSSSGAGGSGTSGMIKNAFNRLVSGNWSGWSGNIKGYKGELMHIKVDHNKTKVDPNSLAICKEIAKIDADKLAQREFDIKEFNYETFQQTIEYIHNGQCKLSYETIPGLICAAEHYDLPDLLHACFHHANTHMKLSAATKMMNALYQNSCFYITAMQLLDSIYAYVDPHGQEFFSKEDHFELYESVVTSLLSRKTIKMSELQKFQAMDSWAKHQVRKKAMTQASASNNQPTTQGISLKMSQQSQIESTTNREKVFDSEEAEAEYRNLMMRLNKEVNIKLDKISNEDIVKTVLPTKVFSNDKIFKIMADVSRTDY